ncbi:MAG: glutamine--fructose-6-phosphate transaminase (isomerizing) [Candidatus Colwellbacteria bacterium CG10_big_fil_rev_8_21_14_0_10_41_28]|uniref:Glutamine--fructose-6-phosphate aminotransferase [isomerizing] n=1 Tax=Candidatus Colwellbacteria bacterium CG10_big_fil_rev_8_21_14_0_10_41_28 TaxID=1974539 RepID=A0A2H0VHY0_9BACT|nr:MAG: glutamine--fructose-6-phosphate transaminase (isomerizing) [Candidatus Colwellbacteria bacterium CG10_big_fil_rev_8_21_14_0_10_41_28]
MCGIVGYIGKRDAIPILMDGLKTLEYRGYDSAGLVGFKGEEVVFEKAVGRVANLDEKIDKHGGFSGNIGIAHTRWATHGGVTELNAHPHTGCNQNIFLVHNGIIENYQKIKDKLIETGHRFYSETDTEVLAHLIEELRDKDNILLEDAVRLALQKIKGTYGLVVVDKRNPYKMVIARNFSPLILGVGKDEFIVASDATAILRSTSSVIYLNDGEIAVLEPDKYRIFNIDNEQVDRTPEELDWDIETAKKGDFPHYMLKEIYEEPEAIKNSIRGRLDLENGKAVLGGLSSIKEDLSKIDRLHISACGTAYIAGLVGEYMIEEYAGVPVEVDYASEVRYRKPIFGKRDAMLTISQSGETADTLAALYEAKEKGILTLGIVNAVGSTISRETGAGVYQHIGPEIGVASTKSFVSQLSILALLTVYIGRKKGMSLVMGKRILDELSRIPEKMERLLKLNDGIKELANRYAGYNNFLYMGRKYNFPMALEGALKIKEIAYVHAEGYASGEMKHGPIALIDKNFPSLIICPQDSVYEKNISNIEEIKARGGIVIAIGTEGDDRIRNLVDDVIYIPKTLEMLTPILVSLPLHLFAYHVGVKKGYDVDKPRNLAKSVTVE